jgi:hypothetical protein
MLMTISGSTIKISLIEAFFLDTTPPLWQIIFNLMIPDSWHPCVSYFSPINAWVFWEFCMHSTVEGLITNLYFATSFKGYKFSIWKFSQPEYLGFLILFISGLKKWHACGIDLMLWSPPGGGGQGLRHRLLHERRWWSWPISSTRWVVLSVHTFTRHIKH